MQLHRIARVIYALGVLMYFCATLDAEPLSVRIISKADVPQIQFATLEIQKSLKGTGYIVVDNDAEPPLLSRESKKGGQLRIVFEIFKLGMGPQSFRIRKEGDRTIKIVGGDSLGAMYGGLELAEMVPCRVDSTPCSPQDT